MSHESPQALLLRHREDIHQVVVAVRAQCGPILEWNDLFALGVEGLLQASRRFDPSLGYQFWTFARPRVRGAMIDAIRPLMPMPRHAHHRLSEASAAFDAAPSATEARILAEHALDAALETVGLVHSESAGLARGEVLGVEDGLDRRGIEESDDQLDPPADDGAARVFRVDSTDPYQALEHASLLQALHTAMESLTLEEQRILRGLYFDERGLVNEELGISKSWTSRIHTRALSRLKAMLAPEWSDARRSAAAPREAP